MIGIFGVFGACADLADSELFVDAGHELTERLESNGHHARLLLWRHSGPKFTNDHAFAKHDGFLTALEGFILNRTALQARYHAASLAELLRYLHATQGTSMVQALRGNFAGSVYSEESATLLLFTDQFGNEPLYYSRRDGVLIFSSQLKWIVEYYRFRHWSPALSISGAYSLLTYGYMYSDLTLLEDVRRLLPGHCVEADLGTVVTKTYYRIGHSKGRLSRSDISPAEEKQRLTDLFLSAVELQARKNVEYGYEQYAPLSAGLDSRMAVMALRKLGYESVTTFTYSRTGEDDCLTPMAISRDLGYNWLFRSLDSGDDLLDIELGTSITEGTHYYIWGAQLDGFMRRIRTDDLGLVHTGIVGDVVVGTFYSKKRSAVDASPYRLGDGGFSRVLLSRLQDFVGEPEGLDFEVGMMMNRGLNGANQGYQSTFRRYGGSASPFMDVALFDFCLSLPPADRYKHKLYYQWVISHFPEAAKYEHNGVSISGSPRISVAGRSSPIGSLPSAIRAHWRSATGLRRGMNPFDYWYDTMPRVRASLDSYYGDHLDVLGATSRLRADATLLYGGNSAKDKLLVLSLLSAMEYFGLAPHA